MTTKKKTKRVRKKSTVSLEVIKALRPCSDRLNNYIEHYKSRKFTPAQFLKLKKITHSDKLWVAFRVLPKDTAVKIAAEIAKSVLHIYESKYPGDDRVRVCIEATLAGTVTLEQRRAAYAAYAAYAAADAAAAYAAYAAYAAADAAADAAAAYAAYAAAKKKARATQEDLNLAIVAKYWK